MFVDRHDFRLDIDLQRRSLLDDLEQSSELSARDLLILVAADAGFSNRRLARAFGVHESTIGRQKLKAKERAARFQNMISWRDLPARA